MTGDEIRDVKFRERIRGYSPAVIDPLIEELAEAADKGAPVADVLRRHPKPFPQKLRGYHPDDVDAFLRKVRAG